MGYSICVIVAAIIAAVSVVPVVTNPRRVANNIFSFSGLFMSAWLLALMAGFLASDRGDYETVERYVRLSFCIGYLPFVGFNQLRLALLHPQWSIGQVFRNSYAWIALAVVYLTLCQTQWFLIGVIPPERIGELALPAYGYGIIPVGAIMFVTLVASVFRMYSATRGATGIQREELRFILLGLAVSMTVMILFSLVLPLLFSSSVFVPYASFGVLALAAITAYGIAKHRILDVRGFLRISTAYAFTGGYLIAIYFTVLGLLWLINVPAAEGHLVSAVVVAFALAPANTFMQRVANQMFGNVGELELKSVLRESDSIIERSVGLNELAGLTGHLIANAAGTDDVRIFLRGKDGLSMVFATPHASSHAALPSDRLIHALEAQSHYPLSRDALLRSSPSEGNQELIQELKALHANLMAAVHSSEGLIGTIVLGDRLSGRMYHVGEQENLVHIADRLGLAIENTQLLRQLIEEKAYTDALVHELSNGLITMDERERIVTLNREAASLLGCDPKAALGSSIENLPIPICTILRDQILEDDPIRNRETALEIDGHVRSISMSSGRLDKPMSDGKQLIYVLLNDRSRIKQLEDLVREHDRLAIVGTLAAGLAHEIKNPLVAIKTFVELLPERKNDAEFLDEFSVLLAGEVERINQLVHRLLNLSRQHERKFVAVSIPSMLSEILQLLTYNFRRQNIRVEMAGFDVNGHGTVPGIPDLLRQAFLNVLLNAMDAMSESGGTLTVNLVSTDNTLEIQVRDTGTGIPPDHLREVFDLFYSTKSNGTGLGLSITHRIVSEHHGSVKVTSPPGHGTTFQISLPRIHQHEATP